MSNRRGSISDYPEHLNPFYEGNEKLRFWKFGKVKRSGSFGESLRNTLTLKSFRGKKKDKQETPSSPPELRKQAPTIVPRQRQTLPTTTLSPIYSPRNSAGPALPRSRFSERVGGKSNQEEVPNGRVPSTEISKTANPFEEDEKVADLKPRRIRRRKRRAPLPPNMAREEGDNEYLGVSSRHSFSKWSLTSVETDVSTYSENENSTLDVINQEMSKLMNNITKEMEKMTDYSENNKLNKTKEITVEEDRSDIPDLIASSTESMKREEINKSASIHVNSEDSCKIQPTDENSNVVPKHLEEEKVEDRNKEQVQNDMCADLSCTKEAEIEEENKETTQHELENSNCDGNKDTSCNEAELKNISNCNENQDVSSNTESDSNRNSCEKSDQEILYNASYNHAASVHDLNYNERKSLYIAASNDQLDKSNSLTDIDNTDEVLENVDINQNERVSLPSSPRCKIQVNVILNTAAPQNLNVEEIENADDKEEAVYSPVPKTRTNKPSKSDLLGNELTEIN